jgi:hypothetical protein
VLPAFERLSLAACVFHAPLMTTSNPHSPVPLLLLLYFVFYFSVLCFYGLMCCIFLPLFISVVTVFRFLWLITRFKSPLMVTPALWHPCLELLGSHLRKHCSRVLSFLSFFLGCSALVMYFLFCCNMLLMYL